MNDAPQVQAKSRFRYNGILSCVARESLTIYAFKIKVLTGLDFVDGRLRMVLDRFNLNKGSLQR